MRRAFYITAILALAAAFLSSYAAKPGNWDREARKRKAEYVFLQANTALSLDSLDAATTMMKRASQLSPGDIDITGQQALMTLAFGNPDSAGIANAYADLLALYRWNPEDYVTGEATATIGRQLRKFDDVIYVWATLDSLYPSRTDPAANLSESYLLRYLSAGDTTDFRKSINILNRLEKGTGRNPGLTSQKVRAYAVRHDTLAIRSELDSLIADFPDDPTPSLLAGSVFQSLGMDSLAVVNFKEACRIDSADGRAFVELANLYRQTGDSVAYDREVFQALESPNLDFNTKFELLRGYVSELYTDSTQWPRTEHMFTVLEQVNPGESRMHALYGSFEVARNRHDRAAEQFTYAMSLDPNDDNIRTTAVQIFLALDSVPAVMATAREGMELFPNNFFYPIVAASTLATHGRAPEAIALLDSVDIRDVNNKRALSNFLTTKGDVLYQADSTDRAFEVYEQAIELNPDNVMAYNNAAYFLSEKDRDLDKALRYAQYAVLSEPSNSTYLDTYAWVYFKRKEYAEARKQIDATLRAMGYPLPGDTIATEAINEIDSIAGLPEADINISDVETEEIPADSDGDLVEVDRTETMDTLNETPSAEVLSHAGDIYFMSGEPDQALRFWKEALELDPDDELLARKVKHKTYFFK